jgi:hypothetical protein
VPVTAFAVAVAVAVARHPSPNHAGSVITGDVAVISGNVTVDLPKCLRFLRRFRLYSVNWWSIWGLRASARENSASDGQMISCMPSKP